MIPIQRKEEMLKLIKKNNICTVEGLTKRFNISNVTVHRILNELEEEGWVNKVHGGVKLASSSLPEIRFNVRMRTSLAQKREIARKAVTFIKEGDSIFLDASTTCFVFAKEISRGNYSDLTVVTNSPFVTCELSKSPNIHVISTGGELQYPLNGLAGSLTLNFIAGLHLDKAFVSAAGISLEKGLMTSQPFIVEVLQKTFEVTNEINLLIDSSKFSKVAILTIAPVTRVTRIISDSKLPKEIIAESQRLGIEIVA